MRIITSDFESQRYWQEAEASASAQDAVHQLSIYPDLTGQTLHGFGGAFTEAAGWCFRRLSDAAQQAVLAAYFGSEGLGYTLGRTHMNSCDFALGNYACQAGPDDPFSLARDQQYILPMLLAAQETAGQALGLLLSPWSPPPFMKTNGDMNHGGALKPEYRAAWADCIARYVQGYRAAGAAVEMVSVQNEPAAVQTWDSCLYSAVEEGIFAADYLRPALDRSEAMDVGILIWDHNKELLVRRARETMAVPGARAAVAGFAYHWYTGDHFEALSLTSRLYPEKALWFTEGCVEFSRFGGASGPDKARMYAHDILGNLRHGGSAQLDWNLLLDDQGGPNHVGNYCEAPLMLQGDGFIRNPSYYAIGHFSRYLRPGAVRLESSVYDGRIEQVVFRNPDGSRAAVLLNRAPEALPLWVTENGETGWSLTLSPGSLTTLIWP